MPRYKLLFLLVALNLIDIATTAYGFSIGKTESNLFFPGHSFIRKELLIGKISVTILYTLLFAIAYKFYNVHNLPKGLWVLDTNLFYLVGLYALGVTNNLLSITMTRI